MGISLKLATFSNVEVLYHQCDITIEDLIFTTLDTIAGKSAKTGAPLYGTIACAGIQQKVPAVEYPVDGFRRIMDVNVTGTFSTIKHSARIFIEEGTKGECSFDYEHVRPSRELRFDMHGIQQIQGGRAADV